MVLAASGCAPESSLSRDAAVEVSGRVLSQRGEAVAGARAVIVKEIGPEEFAAGAMSVVFLGVTCLEDPDVEPCGEFAHHTEADRQGRFTFELRGADVQSGIGTASTMSLTAAAPPRDGAPGPTTTHSFRVQEPSLGVPPHRLWQAAPKLSTTGGKIAVEVPPLGRAYGEPTSSTLLFLRKDGTPVWRSRTAVAVDQRALEELQGTAVVEVATGETREVLRSIYRSAHVAVSGPGVPPSRGAGCWSSSRGRTTVRYSPCPLTDGDLTTTFDPALDPKCRSEERCPQPDTAVTVDLGKPSRVTAVALRGDDDVLMVRTSLDRKSWSKPVTVRVELGNAFAQLPARQARYVSVKAQRWPLPGFTEISVW